MVKWLLTMSIPDSSLVKNTIKAPIIRHNDMVKNKREYRHLNSSSWIVKRPKVNRFTKQFENQNKILKRCILIEHLLSYKPDLKSIKLVIRVDLVTITWASSTGINELFSCSSLDILRQFHLPTLLKTMDKFLIFLVWSNKSNKL